MSKTIIALCCICGGPVYSDGTAKCDLESNKRHEVDVEVEREKFCTNTGLTPEEYLKKYNQDNVNSKTVGSYYMALLLTKEQTTRR